MKYSAKGIDLTFEPCVTQHLYRFMQNEPRKPESGGQLFGGIDGNTVIVKVATGPYKKDKRSRNSYESCPVSAQKAIDYQLSAGLEYLGEWHTHPEESPQASSLDVKAMKNIFAKSKLRTNGLLLAIVGNNQKKFIINTWLIKNNVFLPLNYEI